MMNNYNAQITPDGRGERSFHIQFNTDDIENFRRVEKFIRRCIDAEPNTEMTDNEMLIEAAEMLKENCEKNYNPYAKCACIFAEGRRCCKLRMNPKSWEIPKPRRFTDADIALAKALKEFGADKVTRYISDVACTVHLTYDNKTEEVELPMTTFSDIKDGESVLIDDIIKEGV